MRELVRGSVVTFCTQRVLRATGAGVLVLSTLGMTGCDEGSKDVAGGGGDSCTTGTLGCDCYPNDTCNRGLVCGSADLCLSEQCLAGGNGEDACGSGDGDGDGGDGDGGDGDGDGDGGDGDGDGGGDGDGDGDGGDGDAPVPQQACDFETLAWRQDEVLEEDVSEFELGQDDLGNAWVAITPTQPDQPRTLLVRAPNEPGVPWQSLALELPWLHLTSQDYGLAYFSKERDEDQPDCDPFNPAPEGECQPRERLSFRRISLSSASVGPERAADWCLGTASLTLGPGGSVLVFCQGDDGSHSAQMFIDDRVIGPASVHAGRVTGTLDDLRIVWIDVTSPEGPSPQWGSLTYEYVVRSGKLNVDDLTIEGQASIVEATKTDEYEDYEKVRSQGWRPEITDLEADRSGNTMLVLGRVRGVWPDGPTEIVTYRYSTMGQLWESASTPLVTVTTGAIMSMGLTADDAGNFLFTDWLLLQPQYQPGSSLKFFDGKTRNWFTISSDPAYSVGALDAAGNIFAIRDEGVDGLIPGFRSAGSGQSVTWGTRLEGDLGTALHPRVLATRPCDPDVFYVQGGQLISRRLR